LSFHKSRSNSASVYFIQHHRLCSRTSCYNVQAIESEESDE
jgi:hypothetical protein